MKVLITGSEGFIGKNLGAHLEAKGFNDLMNYDRQTDLPLLDQYAASCDFVFHLAGVNRPVCESGFGENPRFTEELLRTLKKAKKAPPVLMSSSAQALLDNPYGRSKREAEELVLAYGRETGTDVYVFRLPGVFGKWCAPNYNSVVATFCHNIARGLPIRIDDPGAALQLVYIDDVLSAFTAALKGEAVKHGDFYEVEPIQHTTVGKLAEMIQGFRGGRQNMLLADVGDTLTRELFSTYLSYLPEDDFRYRLREHSDERGVFAECFKSAAGGQISVNITKPRKTKGGHWHHTKTEKFVVVSGSGVVRFQKPGGGKVLLYPVSAEKLEVIDVPPGYAHDITNTGDSDMVMLIWTNQIFDPSNPDTYPATIGDRP